VICLVATYCIPVDEWRSHFRLVVAFRDNWTLDKPICLPFNFIGNLSSLILLPILSIFLLSGIGLIYSHFSTMRFIATVQGWSAISYELSISRVCAIIFCCLLHYIVVFLVETSSVSHFTSDVVSVQSKLQITLLLQCTSDASWAFVFLMLVSRVSNGFI